MALAATAARAFVLTDVKQLARLPDDLPFFVLSGGSNVLLPPRLCATALLPRFLGIRVLKEDKNAVALEVAAGEVWDDLVRFCVAKGWYGLENLALIPGLVGAAPIQNIGAYGVQIEDALIGVNAFDLQTRQFIYLDKSDCQFAYRRSVFKTELKKHLIVAVRLKLHKNPRVFCDDYGDLAALTKDLADRARQNVDPQWVMQAVIRIRQQKLPDPKILPNCGSFFHNPILSQEAFLTLKARFGDMPAHAHGDGVKVAAGWLIDKAGLKGLGVDPILTHKNQALVLTNHAPRQATQADVLATERFIQQSVLDRFGVALAREPALVASDGQF